ncbi:hypothetical protein OA848_01200 [Rickettsiales bacterium]|nr:hypothetical protein [Rickettsiales bacterium]
MRKILILISLLFINTNCGFKALYSKNEAILSYNIKIVIKNDPTEKYSSTDILNLKNFLEKRLYKQNAKSSALKLVIGLSRSSYGLGLSKDLSTTKHAVAYNASFVFYDKKGIINKGSIEQSSSFDFGESSFANMVAEETTNKNLLKTLANEISALAIILPKNRKIYP